MTTATEARAKEYELTAPEYAAHRTAREIKQYESAIAAQKKYLEQMGDGIRPKAREQAQWKIQSWERQLARLQSGEWQKVNASYLQEQYGKMVKKAISTGQPVPQHVIDQAPEYKAAQTARERYEKGWKTSFANRSVAINEQMKEELGYKVKRQDGKPITSGQLDEIARGVGEVEKALGPLHDLFDKTDITIVHTSGKHPFLTGVGGTYTPSERAVNMGVAGTKATGHEIGHWLDHESGKVEHLTTRLWGKTGHKAYETSSTAESSKARYSGQEETPLGKLIREATFSINNAREVRDLMKKDYGKNLSDEDKAEVKLIRERLSPYWREPREVWARLVEQYIATTNEHGEVATDPRSFYEKRPGWWTREDFAKMMPLVEQQIRGRVRAIRGSDVAPPRKSATAEKKLEQFADNVKQIEKAIPVQAETPAPTPKATPATKGKEPWEMTREEFQQGKLRYLGPESVASGERPAGVASSKQQGEIGRAKQLGLATIRLDNGEVVYGKTIADAERLADALKRGVTDPELSQLLGYTDADREALSQYGYRAHQEAIKQALTEGKPVTKEVLKDYPGLTKQAKAAPTPKEVSMTTTMAPDKPKPEPRTLGAGDVPDIGSEGKPVVSPYGLPAYRKNGFWYYQGWSMTGSGELDWHRVTDPRQQERTDALYTDKESIAKGKKEAKEWQKRAEAEIKARKAAEPKIQSGDIITDDLVQARVISEGTMPMGRKEIPAYKVVIVSGRGVGTVSLIPKSFAKLVRSEPGRGMPKAETLEETAKAMGLTKAHVDQAKKEGVTTALGLRRIEKNMRADKRKAKPKAPPKDKPEDTISAAEGQRIVDRVQASRTSRALGGDRARRAQTILPLEKAHIWAKAPHRYDIRGVDTPGSGTIKPGVGYADKGAKRLSRKPRKGWRKVKLA